MKQHNSKYITVANLSHHGLAILIEIQCIFAYFDPHRFIFELCVKIMSATY